MKQEETDRNERTGMVAATLALAMLLASLGTSIANIALPALAAAFSASFGAAQAVVVAYLAGLTAVVVVAGRLGDVHGLKRMLVAGLGLFAVASLVCGLAPSLPLLVAARAVQGIGAAFLMTLSMALIRETAGEARVGRAMGLLGTMSALGMALGPVLGGMLVPATGWRGVFLVQAPLAGLGLIFAIAVLPARAGAKRSAPSTWAAFEGSIAPNLVVNLAVAAVMMTTLVVGPFYLGFGLGLEDMLVGLVMSVGPVISIFSGVPSGRLVDAWGTGRVLAAGLLALAAGAFLLAFLPEAIGLGGYVLAIVVLTPGYQLFQAANNVATLSGVSGDRRGTVSGLLGLSRNIGLVAGASVMGAVFALGAGTEDLAHAAPSAIAAGMRLTFLAAGGLMIAAIAVVGLAGRPSQ